MLRSYLTLANENDGPLPEGFAGPDVRFPPRLVEVLLGAFTREGDVVLDPFAGFGTTLTVAERMGRIPCGLEYDPARCAYVRSRLRDPAAVFCGDSRRLREYPLPHPVDFALTSPPYMGRGDAEDPLTAYAEPFPHGSDGYAAYLDGLANIFDQVRERLRPGARSVIEVANLKRADGVTTLAWDVARAVGGVLPFEREIVVCWEPTYGFGYDHSYCLVFRKPG